MSTPKGWPSSQKLQRVTAEHSSISPAGQFKHALDVRDNAPVFVRASDLAEASSTASVINATSHVAKKGDRIRFTSGVHQYIEADVVSTTANTITLGWDLDAAVGTGDGFDILRPVSPTYQPDGSLPVSGTFTAGPLLFTRNGADQEVTEDTVTPANNRPLPVKLVGLDGDVNINATNLNLEVQLAHNGAAPDSVQIGDGSQILLITGAGQAEVHADQLPAALGQAAMAASLSVVIASNQSAVPVADGGGSLTVDGTVAISGTVDVSGSTVDVGVVPITDNGGSLTVDGTVAISGTVDVSGSTVDVGVVPVTDNGGSLTVDGTVAVTDGGGSITVDGAVTVSATDLDIRALAFADDKVDVTGSSVGLAAGTNNIGDVDVLTLPSIPAGTNNIGDVDVLTLPAIPAGTNRIGSVDVNLDVVDFIDTTPVLDSASTNIPASASNPVEIVASLAANVKKIRVNDTTGEFIGVYTGVALSEVLQAVIGPGMDGDLEVQMASGERVSLRNMANSAISTGKILIQFYG